MGTLHLNDRKFVLIKATIAKLQTQSYLYHLKLCHVELLGISMY